MILASMTTCQVAQAVAVLLPVEFQLVLLEFHAKRLNISISLNLKDGLPISADHRWHQEFVRGNGAKPRTEHPDMGGV